MVHERDDRAGRRRDESRRHRAEGEPVDEQQRAAGVARQEPRRLGEIVRGSDAESRPGRRNGVTLTPSPARGARSRRA